MALLSPGAWLEERGQRDNLFHSKVLVQDRGCAVTIDHWSSINAISLEMVEKLNLPTTLHPQPYTLPWCPDFLLVKYQTKVQCSIGLLSFEVLCDVVPKYLVAFHMLLGEPWCTEHAASYSMDADTARYCKYTVFHAGRKINLISMETAVFKSWREERLQRKEEEEKKKRDAELCVVSMPIAEDDAAVVIAPVSAATEDIDHTSDAYCVEVDVFRVCLKPRSVSPEGGEDDMAPPMFNGGYYAIPGYVIAEIVKPQFLFLFLPRKEKIKVAIGVPCWWRVLSLQESG